jgi:hypothetical protein
MLLRMLMLLLSSAVAFVSPPPSEVSSQHHSTSTSTLAASSSSSTFTPQALPLVLSIEMKPGSIKAGGLMTYLRLLALGRQKGEHPYQTMPSADGLTCVFADARPGAEPAGAISIQLERNDEDVFTGLVCERLDPSRHTAYAGERTIMMDLAVALLDLSNDPSIAVSDSLFQLTAESKETLVDFVQRGGSQASVADQSMFAGAYAWWQEFTRSLGLDTP